MTYKPYKSPISPIMNKKNRPRWYLAGAAVMSVTG